MIKSVEDYLDLLKAELNGSDAATIQDALADAEEHLRAALGNLRKKRSDRLSRSMVHQRKPLLLIRRWSDVPRRSLSTKCPKIFLPSANFLACIQMRVPGADYFIC